MNPSDFSSYLDSKSNASPVTEAKKPKSLIGLVGLGLTAGGVLALSIGTAPFISPALRKFCLPFVPATEKQVRNVLSALPKKGTLVDIGSGDGRIVLEAAKNGFKATGYELNPWLVIYSRIRALRLGLSTQANFVRRDLWKANFGQYNNVVIFGVDQMMPRLEEKLQEELSPGAKVVACRFPFPRWQPTKAVGEGIDRVWLYDIPECFKCKVE